MPRHLSREQSTTNCQHAKLPIHVAELVSSSTPKKKDKKAA